jgi:hypothetical protein
MLDHPDDALHVAACTDCQARASLEGLDVDLDRVWAGVAAEVWAPRVGLVERLAGRLLGSPGLARALVTTPSLVLSWIVASAVLLAVGVLVTRTTGLPLVALLAPALTGIGIAYAYGPGVDPAFELSQSLAVSDRMVLLVRALAVCGVNAALGLVASLFAAEAAGLTLGWLVPMTTVAALALAAATLARSANVGVVVALAGWCIVVLAAAVGTRDLATAVLQANLTPAYVVGTLVGIGVALYATSGRQTEERRWLRL